MKIEIPFPEKYSQTLVENILEGAAYQLGYREEIEVYNKNGIKTLESNPETALKFLIRNIYQIIIKNYKASELNRTTKTAEESKTIEINSLLKI